MIFWHEILLKFVRHASFNQRLTFFIVLDNSVINSFELSNNHRIEQDFIIFGKIEDALIAYLDSKLVNSYEYLVVSNTIQ